MVEEDIKQAYRQGFVEGYHKAMKATWKEQYETLVQEIEEDMRNRIMNIIKEYYDGKEK